MCLGKTAAVFRHILPSILLSGATKKNLSITHFCRHCICKLCISHILWKHFHKRHISISQSIPTWADFSHEESRWDGGGTQSRQDGCPTADQWPCLLGQNWLFPGRFWNIYMETKSGVFYQISGHCPAILVVTNLSVVEEMLWHFLLFLWWQNQLF